ncbi:MAG: DUF1761 domain-containing protein [Chlorobi bacterium]|nr:DUF1761 domain-containing protein [Chlorobiota bacterium]
MLKIIQLNLLAICIATLIGVVLGLLWYSPLLFRKVLIIDLEKNNKKINELLFPFLISIFGAFILAVILDLFLFFSNLAGMPPFYAATIIGSIMAVGIIALNMLSDYLLSGIHIKHFIVHAGYRIALTLIIAWTLAFWR